MPENIFPLTADTLPTFLDADLHGNVLFYCAEHGWLVAHFNEAMECLTENKCTHWTYTPFQPI